MNQLCKVCGEPAAGYHFGAFTCEGCKSFFGRTYNNLAALGECKNNGQCVINKKNRTSCKSCRLKKCLMVGMSKSGSRYGRRSNWFKIHCLIQDQAEMSSRLAEGASPFTETKDLVAQYNPGSLSGKSDRPTSRTNHSSNGASPSSRHSSDAGRAHSVPSPYASLLEAAAKARFDGAVSPSALVSAAVADQKHHSSSRRERDTHRQQHHHHHDSSTIKDPLHLSSRVGQLSPGAAFPGFPAMPLSPISPLSPLTAASRFFFNHPSAQLFKGLQQLPGLYNSDLMANYAAAAYQSRFMPLHALNPVVKSSVKSEGVASTASPSSSELLAEVAEQDRPIDLSVKSSNELRLSPTSPLAMGIGKSSKQGDGDSGFSPSSNEEAVNTSPLDLTRTKRAGGLVGSPGPIDDPDVDDEEDEMEDEVVDPVSGHSGTEDDEDDEDRASSPLSNK